VSQCYGKPKRSGVKPRQGKVKSGFVKYGYRCVVSRIVAVTWSKVAYGLGAVMYWSSVAFRCVGNVLYRGGIDR